MAMESVSASAPGTVAMEILPVLEEDESSPGSEERMRPRAGGSFNRERYYLLAVIGEIGSELQLDAAREHIERGIRCWDVDLEGCDLNHQLRLFITRHSAHFSSEVRGSAVEAAIALFVKHILLAAESQFSCQFPSTGIEPPTCSLQITV